MRALNLLIVDDNAADVMLAGEAIEESGIRVRLSVARDGVEAIEFLTRQGMFLDAPKPDLILLDLNMPRMNGIEVLAEIKASAGLRTIPVIVFTTSDSPHDIETAYGHHANGYIVKPLEMEKWVATMRAIDAFWIQSARLPSFAF